jgi:hypothetical protein
MARTYGTLAEYDTPGQSARFDRAMDYVRRRFPNESARTQELLARAVIIRGAVPSDIRADLAEGKVVSARQRLEAITDPSRPKNLGWLSRDDTPGTGTWPERRKWWEDPEASAEDEGPKEAPDGFGLGDIGEARRIPEGRADQNWMAEALHGPLGSVTIQRHQAVGEFVKNQVENVKQNLEEPHTVENPEDVVNSISDPEDRARARKALEENRAVQTRDLAPITAAPAPNVAVPENARSWFDDPNPEEANVEPADRFNFGVPASVAATIGDEIDAENARGRFGYTNNEANAPNAFEFTRRGPNDYVAGPTLSSEQMFWGIANSPENKARRVAEIEAEKAARTARAEAGFSIGDVLSGAGSILNSLFGIGEAGAAEVRQRQRALGATRSRPISKRLNNVLEYAARKAGVDVEVYSGGQPAKGSRGSQGKRVGSTRHDLGNAADVRLYTVDDNGKRKRVNFLTKKGREVYRNFIEAAAAAGATGIGAGQGYMGAESIHVGFGSVADWGSAFDGKNQKAFGFKAAKNRGRRNRVKNLNRELAQLRKEDKKAATKVADTARSQTGRSSLGAPKSGTDGKRVDRRALARELARDPGLRQNLLELAQAEVGAYGEKAIQGFLETVFNRAQLQGTTLDNIVRGPKNGKRYYAPYHNGGKAFRRAQRHLKSNPIKRDLIAQQLDKVIAGSNTTNLATHNASAGVGRRAKQFNKGYAVEVGNNVGKEVFYTKTGRRKGDPDERSFRRRKVAYLDEEQAPATGIKLVQGPPRFSSMGQPRVSTATAPMTASLGNSAVGLPASVRNQQPVPQQQFTSRPAIAGTAPSFDPRGGVVTTQGFGGDSSQDPIEDARTGYAEEVQNDETSPATRSSTEEPAQARTGYAEEISDDNVPELSRGAPAGIADVDGLESRAASQSNQQAQQEQVAPVSAPRSSFDAEEEAGVVSIRSTDQQARENQEAARAIATQAGVATSAGPPRSAREAEERSMREAEAFSRRSQFAQPNLNAPISVSVISQAELDAKVAAAKALAEPETSRFTTPDLKGGVLTGLQDDRLGYANVTPATTAKVNQFGNTFGFEAQNATPVAQNAFGTSLGTLTVANRNEDPFAAQAMDDLMSTRDPVASVGFNKEGPAAVGSFRSAQEIGFDPNSALGPRSVETMSVPGGFNSPGVLGPNISDRAVMAENYGPVSAFSPGAGFASEATTNFSDVGFGTGIGFGSGIDGISVGSFGANSFGSNDFGGFSATGFSGSVGTNGFGDFGSGSFSQSGLGNSFSNTGFGATAAAAGLSPNTGVNANFGSFGAGFGSDGFGTSSGDGGFGSDSNGGFGDSGGGGIGGNGGTGSSGSRGGNGGPGSSSGLGSSGSSVSSSESATSSGHSDAGVGGSECFLTTACTRSEGLPDNCEELEAMRHLRDAYMRTFPEGQRDVEEYYAFAPMIVDAVDKRDDAQEIWSSVLDAIRVVKDQVEAGMYQDAHATYKRLYDRMFAIAQESRRTL